MSNENHNFSAQDLSDEIGLKIKKILTVHGLQITAKIRENIIANKQIAFTNMINSNIYKVDDKKDSFILSFGVNAKNKGISYPGALEYGRKAGFPPVSALVSWIKRKLALGHLKLKGDNSGLTKNGKLSKSTDTEKAIKSFAWAIAKHKSEHATPPKPFIKNLDEIYIDLIEKDLGTIYE